MFSNKAAVRPWPNTAAPGCVWVCLCALHTSSLQLFNAPVLHSRPLLSTLQKDIKTSCTANNSHHVNTHTHTHTHTNCSGIHITKQSAIYYKLWKCTLSKITLWGEQNTKRFREAERIKHWNTLSSSLSLLYFFFSHTHARTHTHTLSLLTWR